MWSLTSRSAKRLTFALVCGLLNAAVRKPWAYMKCFICIIDCRCTASSSPDSYTVPEIGSSDSAVSYFSSFCLSCLQEPSWTLDRWRWDREVVLKRRFLTNLRRVTCTRFVWKRRRDVFFDKIFRFCHFNHDAHAQVLPISPVRYPLPTSDLWTLWPVNVAAAIDTLNITC